MKECRAGVYNKIRIDGKQVFEHRFLAEQKIGRKLCPEEFVHHIDGNKINNNPENLEVISRKEHGLRHRKPNRKRIIYPSGTNVIKELEGIKNG